MAERDGLMLAQLVHEPYVDVSETHSAVVFFVGDRAYKLKKPVNLGFLDFSTPEARAAACQREAELNRRFAPDVYLGVMEVRDSAGRVCDHLVAMRRMPAGRRLSALIQAREPVSAAVRQVARILAAEHASAPRGPAISEQGSRDGLRCRWMDNIEQIRPLQGGVPAESGGVSVLHGGDGVVGHCREPGQPNPRERSGGRIAAASAARPAASSSAMIALVDWPTLAATGRESAASASPRTIIRNLSRYG